MNKHILLIMKWLQNPESVSPDPLKSNSNEADVVYSRVYGEVFYAAAHAAASYVYDDELYTSRCVDAFFKVSGEGKQSYIDAISK